MKPMTKYTNNIGDSGDTEGKVTVTIDYLPLLAEFEIFGTTSYANQYEKNNQKQYEYYVVGNQKTKSTINSASKVRWFERSCALNAMYFAAVKADGGAGSQSANQSNGIAPIFKV